MVNNIFGGTILIAVGVASAIILKDLTFALFIIPVGITAIIHANYLG